MRAQYVSVIDAIGSEKLILAAGSLMNELPGKKFVFQHRKSMPFRQGMSVTGVKRYIDHLRDQTSVFGSLLRCHKFKRAI